MKLHRYSSSVNKFADHKIKNFWTSSFKSTSYLPVTERFNSSDHQGMVWKYSKKNQRYININLVLEGNKISYSKVINIIYLNKFIEIYKIEWKISF